MDFYQSNYPTGRLYTFLKGNDLTFIKGRPYLFVRWSRPINPFTLEKMDFLNAVFFANGREVLVDKTMLKKFKIVE